MSPRLIAIFCILIAAVGEAYGQVAFKHAANRAGKSGESTHPLKIVAKHYRWIALGVSGFVIQAAFWSVGLRHLDVSLAYPLGSLDLVVIVLICRLWLREAVGTRRWIGVLLIICGTALVGSS